MTDTLLQEFHACQEIPFSHVDGGYSDSLIGAGNHLGLGAGLGKVCRGDCRVEEKITGIYHENRLSFGTYFFYGAHPPGQTAQRRIPSRRAGKEMSGYVVRMDNRDGEVICHPTRRYGIQGSHQNNGHEDHSFR